MKTPHQPDDIISDRQGNNYFPLKNQPPSNNCIRLNKTKKYLIAEIYPVSLPAESQDLSQLGLLISSIVFEAFEGYIQLEINEQTFSLQWKLSGFSYKQVRGQTRDIRWVKLSPTGTAVNNQLIEACTLVERMETHQFGTMLETEQKQWLVEEILDFLTQLQPRISKADSPALKLTKPRGSRVVLQKNRDRLLVTIPPTGFRWYHYLPVTAVIAIVYFNFAAGVTLEQFISSFIPSTSLRPSIFSRIIPLLPIALFFTLMPFFIYLVFLIGFGVFIVRRFALRTQIEIDRQTFKIEWNCLGFRRQVRGQVAHLKDVLVADSKTYIFNQNQQRIQGCILVEGILNRSFGSSLKIKEQRWVVAELAEFLGFTKALRIKGQHQPKQSSTLKKLQQPIGSQIKFKKTEQYRFIHIPASSSFSTLLLSLLMCGVFIASIGGLIGLFIGLILAGGLMAFINIIFAGSIDQLAPWQANFLAQILATIPVAILITFWLKVTLLSDAASTEIEINRSTFRIKWKALGFKKEVKGKTANINEVKLQDLKFDVNGQIIKTPTLSVGHKNYFFGQRLAPEEKQWLIDELSNFLGFTKPIN